MVLPPRLQGECYEDALVLKCQSLNLLLALQNFASQKLNNKAIFKRARLGVHLTAETKFIRVSRNL